MKNDKTTLWLMLVLLFAGSVVLNGSPLYNDRIYEPVIVYGDDIGTVSAGFDTVDVDSLFLFAYRSGTWEMIPFQIDERVRLDDPDLSKGENNRLRHFYVIANTNGDYVREDTASGFDGDDELSFLIRDMGDKAPETTWIDNEESRKFPRIEIVLTDPENSDNKAYGYLYRSSTLTMPEEVASRYGMQYDPDHDLIQSNMYQLKMDEEKGFIQDIILNAPYGNGVDFFDVQKMRMNAHIDLGIGFALDFGEDWNPGATSATESILYYFDREAYQAYSEHPVVRVIRERRYSLGFGGTSIGNTEFYLKTFNYPFSGDFVGGASLNPSDVKEAFGDSSVTIDIRITYIRQSWDFNSNAAGMTFQSENNSAIPIDGVPDSPDRSLTPGDSLLQTWTMTTGDQGTLYNFYTFPKSSWDMHQLYYYDNSSGGYGDGSLVNADDSGYEYGSYGDNGLQFFKEKSSSWDDDYINLDFGFNAYFLPANQSRNIAEDLTTWLKNPPDIKGKKQYETTVSVKNHENKLSDFQLDANYPNPFNPVTSIGYQLPKAGRVRLSIFDVQGRYIRDLVNDNLQAGEYSIEFDASNLTSGVYYYQLQTERHTETRKMLLMK